MTCCNNAKEKAADKLEEFAKTIRNSDIDAKIHEKVEPVETFVKEHPIPSVLIGVGAGILIGALIGKYYKTE